VRHILTGTHSCIIDRTYGDWRVNGKTGLLYIQNLLKYIKDGRKPISLNYSDICWKGDVDIYIKRDNPLCKERYINANIDIPGIVVRNASNPSNKEYRMIDGTHRTAKRIIESSYAYGLFYIITNAEFEDTILFN